MPHSVASNAQIRIFLDSCLKLKTAMLFFNILSAWCKMKIESYQTNWCSDRIDSVNAWKPSLVLLKYHTAPRLEVRAHGASTAAPLFSDLIHRHQCRCYGMGPHASSASTWQRHWLLIMYCVKKVDAEEVDDLGVNGPLNMFEKMAPVTCVEKYFRKECMIVR